ncbi:hypothetical protein [Paenimyroides aestuarii]|uniref:Uncharacterized protein n=1 Tax=Paenimyroides aestuarii TaxID=2968490 RepID=A0ABY5NUB2_9FLAO|nr:hypothetical protein [Paenimyroides aestuarii]UUV22176.1 hypothetical protein NPX36_03830 [Paenimyroides aestuarii]
MKLSVEQIEQLFTFTKKHFVEHYDVQVELVDHLANAIEDQWKENPNILFEDALQTEFKKFGVFGFTGLVEQKQAQLHKYYNKMLWNEVLRFVSIPKVIITAVFYLGIFYLLNYYTYWAENVLLAIMFISFLYLTIDGFRFMLIIKKEQKNKQRTWLIQSVAQSVFSLPIIGFGGFYFNMFGHFFESSNELSVLGMHFLSLFFLLHFILFHVFFKIIKPKFKNEIRQTEKRFQFV